MHGRIESKLKEYSNVGVKGAVNIVPSRLSKRDKVENDGDCRGR